MNITESLLKMKNEIKVAETNLARLDGEMSTYFEELKKEGYIGIEAAHEALVELQEERRLGEEELQKGVEALETQFYEK